MHNHRWSRDAVRLGAVLAMSLAAAALMAPSAAQDDDKPSAVERGAPPAAGTERATATLHVFFTPSSVPVLDVALLRKALERGVRIVPHLLLDELDDRTFVQPSKGLVELIKALEIVLGEGGLSLPVYDPEGVILAQKRFRLTGAPAFVYCAPTRSPRAHVVYGEQADLAGLLSCGRTR